MGVWVVKIMEIRDVDCAYLAGLMDGDGHITIIKQKVYGKRKAPFKYRVYVQITNTNEEALKHLHKLFGGSLRISGKIPSKDGKKTLYRLSWVCRGARKILRGILPYLHVKAEDAKIVLNCPFSLNHRRRTEEIKKAQDRAWLALRKRL